MEIQNSVIPIVLAGGKGSRISDIVESNNRPKPLLTLNGKPFICFILDQLIFYGFKEVIISIGYKKEKWLQVLGREYNGLKIYYAIEHEPLGTGGAVKNSLSLVDENKYSKIMILNGDTLVDLDFDKFIGYCSPNKATITAIKNKENNRYGSIILEKDKVLSFVEKQNDYQNNYINGGIYCFNYQFLNEQLPRYEQFSIEKDCFQNWIDNNIKINAYKIDNAKFIDIGTHESFDQFSEFIKTWDEDSYL